MRRKVSGNGKTKPLIDGLGESLNSGRLTLLLTLGLFLTLLLTYPRWGRSNLCVAENGSESFVV